MSKEYDYSNWKRDHMGDQPALRGDDENLRTDAPVIPQQIGFDVDGTLVQVSYDRALELGLIDKTEERWHMYHRTYLKEQNI